MQIHDNSRASPSCLCLYNYFTPHNYVYYYNHHCRNYTHTYLDNRYMYIAEMVYMYYYKQ